MRLEILLEFDHRVRSLLGAHCAPPKSPDKTKKGGKIPAIELVITEFHINLGEMDAIEVARVE
jgi:hypothetical protein